MNLVKVFKLYGDYIFDFKKKIEYKVVKYKKPDPSKKKLIIFHEYEDFSEIRLKRVKNLKYYCGHGTVFDAIGSFDAYKVLTIARGSHIGGLKKYYNLFDLVIITNNIAQDFGGYFSAFKELKNRGLVFSDVTILNSSQYLEKNELTRFFDCELKLGSFAGVSYAYGPNFILCKHFHLQSYLLKYKYQDLVEILDGSFELDLFYSSKYSLISRAEVRLSKLSIKKGLKPFLFEDNLMCSIDFKKVRLLKKDGRLDPNFAWKDKFTINGATSGASNYNFDNLQGEKMSRNRNYFKKNKR